jgi:hypothetical protein
MRSLLDKIAVADHLNFSDAGAGWATGLIGSPGDAKHRLETALARPLHQ